MKLNFFFQIAYFISRSMAGRLLDDTNDIILQARENLLKNQEIARTVPTQYLYRGYHLSRLRQQHAKYRPNYYHYGVRQNIQRNAGRYGLPTHDLHFGFQQKSTNTTNNYK